MSLTNCPHCSSPIPPAFAAMPICSICGGDLKAAPSAPVWSSIDIKTDNSRECPKCHTNVKSILAMECPSCGSALALPGTAVEDIEKEKKVFESAVQASQKAPEPKPKTAPLPAAQPAKVAAPEKVLTPNTGSSPSKEAATLKSNSSGKEVKPYPQREKDGDFVSLRDKAKQKKKEGFFTKLLRMLGLKKDQ
jgi:hypothetical protein